MPACERPDGPGRAELRNRLLEEAPLTAEELDGLRVEITRSMGDATFRVREADGTRPLDPQQRALVFGMLTQPAGMFDEGLRREGDASLRILNAPGPSPSSEIDAARRLWIDVATFLPRRFEYTYGFPSPENYTYDLIAEP